MLFKIAEEQVRQAGLPGVSFGLPRRLAGLRAVVMLAGSVRANQLRKSTGRSALELPVGDNRTVLDCWREQLVTMAEQLGMDRLPVRVIVDRASGMVPGESGYGPLSLSIEHEPGAFRGTGGLLSDLAAGYRDDDLVMVGHASQLLFEPLAELAGAMADAGADVSLVCSRDGTPAGLMLVRCGALRKINPVGFVDLNEQALPAIARDHDVRVVRYDQPISRSLRTRAGYLETLGAFHRRHAGAGADAASRPEEDWHKTFGVVEPGARVHATAVVHDSVVLGGAVVEAGAVLVRCVVCPDAVVGRDVSAMDRVVGRAPRAAGFGPDVSESD
ncbi:MAG: hypothetical protein AAF800_01825 [Planctomycetota bacterium]